VKIVFLIILSLFFDLSSVSQTLSDSVSTEEILVTANKLKMKTIESPNKIEVINSAMLENSNGRDLSSVLKNATNLFIKDYGFRSGLKTISLNSTQSEQTLILLDGMKLNNPQNGQVDLNLISIDNIERIEISYGGLSSIYGSEAVGGVINLITKNNTKKLSLNVSGSFGSYDYKRFYASIGKLFRLKNNHSLIADISYSDESSPNRFEFYYFNGLTSQIRQRENVDYVTRNFQFKSIYQNKKKYSLNLFSVYTFSNRGVPGTEIGYTSSKARQEDKTLFSSLSFDKIFDSFKLSTSFDYTNSLLKYFDPATVNLTVPVNSFYKLNLVGHKTDLHFEFRKLEGVIGYHASHSNLNSNETQDAKRTQFSTYLSLKHEFFLSNIKFSFYPSARYDYYSDLNEKNVLTGKLGINIKPFDKADLTIKSTFGNNFRAPTFNDLYWKELGNPNLKPERSVSFDAGLFYRFNFIFHNEAEASYYYIATTDRILWQPNSVSIWHPVNVGKVESKGIDVSIKSSFVSDKKINATFRINYSYGEAIKKNEDFPGDPSVSKQLIYIPRTQFKSALAVKYLPSSKFLNFVSLHVFYNYAGKRFTNFENTLFVPYYETIDANVSVNMKVFTSAFEIKFGVNNLLNKDYKVIPGYPMPIRNYLVEAGFKY